MTRAESIEEKAAVIVAVWDRFVALGHSPEVSEADMDALRYALALPKTVEVYELGYIGIRDLNRAVREHGASGEEVVAIERLQEFRAEAADLERLARLAKLARVDLPRRET